MSRSRAPEQDETEVRLGKTLDFMRRLWALDHALGSASKSMQSRLGVTGLQRLVVRVIGRFPGVSAGAVAKVLHVHPSTLTGVFEKLVERRLIERKPDPQDARRAILSLTPAGRVVDELRAGTVEAAVHRALGDLSEKKIDAVRDALDVIIQELERV